MIQTLNKHFLCFLQEKEQGKNIVVVGSWDATEHIDWAKKNVARSYQLKEDGIQKVKYVPLHLSTSLEATRAGPVTHVSSLFSPSGWFPTFTATGTCAT